ncbi:MAG: hypothetical protein ACYC64_14845 [Armatimonadota bacterium]
MRLFVMVLALILACGAAAVAADSCNPCPTAPTCPSDPCATPACPSPSPAAAMRAQTIDTCLMCTLGLTQQQICDLRSQGYSDRDIAMAGAIAKKACVSVDDVIAAFCQCKDWNSVVTKYNLGMADVQALAAQCTCPQPCPTGAGPCQCYVIYSKTGNVLLTRDDARRYYWMGYDWMDVALATNIAMETGYPILTTLMDVRRGVTYEEIARMQGVPYEVAFNFVNYPFPRTSVYSAKINALNIQKYAKWQMATTANGLSPMITLPGLNPSY